MSGNTLQLVAGGVLLLHGVAHVGAIAALAWVQHFGPGSTGNWLAARTWLVPSLDGGTATAIACAFWLVALVGFVTAALGFWGILPIAAWRGLAGLSAVVSGAGIVAFLGTWPVFNTTAALAVNAGVLVALVIA